MDTDLIKTVLGSSALVGLVGAIIAGLMKIHQNRFQARREDAKFELLWAADYRAAAETHLTWDQEMRAENLFHRTLINELRENQGLPPIEFKPIPPAPPLFPRREGGERK